ncbi:MAG: hypothetical protein PGN07_12220 [Aeromicrobium erythreum]
MSRWNRRQAPQQAEGATGFTGVVRFARPGDPAKTLREGEIAVIDVADLERGQAEELVEAGVRAVVNAASSSTGRYPNLGPKVLAEAGVVLVDRVGDGIWSRLRSGDTVRVDGARIFKDDVLVAQGVELDDATVSQQLGDAEQGLSTRLGSLDRERERPPGARARHAARGRAGAAPGPAAAQAPGRRGEPHPRLAIGPVRPAPLDASARPRARGRGGRCPTPCSARA